MASERLNCPLSLRRAGHIAVCRGRYILVWGGYREPYSDANNRYLPTNEIWIYDSLLQTWNVEYTRCEVPPGTSGSGHVLLDDSLYIIGGYCEELLIPSGNTNALYHLHLPSGKWEKVQTNGLLPIPCDKMASWIHDRKIYIFGGFGLNPLTFNNCYTKDNFDFVSDESHFVSIYPFPRGWNNQFVMFDPETKSWIWPKWKGRKPIARAAHACAKLGNIVYIFGGRHRATRMNDMHYIDMSTMTWSGRLPIAEPVPEGRSWHSLTPMSKSKLVLFGGFSQIRKALNDCWIFDTEGLFWSEVNLGMVQTRFWHTSCMAQPDELVVIGGSIENVLNDATVIHAQKQATNLIVLYFSPKSLLRISLDAVANHRLELETYWPTLPKTLQDMLVKKVAVAR